MANARKHDVPAGGDATVNRATIFETFGNSIHDIVPVANVTERTQLVSDLIDEGVGPSSSNPLYVDRADARALHRVERTEDGTLWLPVSGRLEFADLSARNSWTTSNSGLLSVRDRCIVGTIEYAWNGTAWVAVTYTRGYVAQGTSSGGIITVNHGLGVEPLAVVIGDTNIGGVPGTRKVQVSAKSPTQIQFYVSFLENVSGVLTSAPVPSTPVEFSWIAAA